MKRILVTGGAGFIGSNFVHHLLQAREGTEVVVLDKLTYAGNLDNLKDIRDDARLRFVHGDIAVAEDVSQAMAGCDAVVNFAAETHVDRSLLEPGAFITTDVFGTYVLLEAARQAGVERFIQISTDEVYGSIDEGSFTETDLLSPSSPYSASKAGGEMMARAYFTTYQLPVIVTRASNNYGPYQYPEKLIPLFITNAIDDQPLPVYGDGRQVRDWLHVTDHCQAVDQLLQAGEPGQIYNIGGGNERTNIEITTLILSCLGKPETLIRHITDRPGHDRRYSIACKRMQGLGWQPQVDFTRLLSATVEWYAENEWWWRPIKSGEFARYYQDNYARRHVLAGQGG